jgi:hypothetical protein
MTYLKGFAAALAAILAVAAAVGVGEAISSLAGILSSDDVHLVIGEGEQAATNTALLLTALMIVLTPAVALVTWLVRRRRVAASTEGRRRLSRRLVLSSAGIGLVAIVAGWALFSDPHERRIFGAVTTWPVTIQLASPVRATRRATEVCLVLPPDFQGRPYGQSPDQPPVFAPGGARATVTAEVCLDDGRCLLHDGWMLLRQTGRTLYCPTLRGEQIPIGRRITAVRLYGNEVMRANAVSILSYDPK